MKYNNRKKKKYCKEGFLLIEAIIYCACSSIFFILLFQLTAYSYNNCMQLSRRSSDNISIHIGLDLITRDLYKLSSVTGAIKKISAYNLIFSSDNTDIGWELKNSKLLRTEGKYINNIWHNKTESTVMDNVKTLQFDIKQIANQISSISVTLNSFKKTIAVRNKEIL